MKLVGEIRRMKPDRAEQVLRVASVLAIGALLLMMWPLVDPTPAPVLIALSVGQAIGTLSFAAYLTIVIWDLRRRRRGSSVLDPVASVPPAPPSSRSDVTDKE